MEALLATMDPVLQQAARIGGFAEAMVQDTPSGRVVLARHRFGGWAVLTHLATGQSPLDAFYGTAFWERADVLAMYQRQEERREVSRVGRKDDIGRDFVRELGRQVRRRVDGAADLLEALRGLRVRA